MSILRLKRFAMGAAALSAVTCMLLLAPAPQAQAKAPGTAVTIKGEIIDTWCYLSGVMGGPDAIVGSAHHTCALWCAAGGIPVGVRAEDGTVYMVLKVKGEDPQAASDTVMELQSDTVVAKGTHYVRDGINYLVVAEVVQNLGIVNPTHDDYGPVPPNAVPEK